jgi:hypothetical protein
MAEYATSVDIANKALLHLGASMIVAFTDNSKNAVTMNFLYDKCRQAELLSTVWKFSIAYQTLVAGSPATQAYQNGTTRNRFVLPSSYVRMADQDPRTAGTATQGSSAGLQWRDYSVESGNILTAQTSVILRFVSDVTIVTTFDALFCEMLAARIAFDACEVITQNLQKRAQIAQMYADRFAMAKLLNLIETATDEPIEAEAMLARIALPAPGAQPQPRPQARGR